MFDQELDDAESRFYRSLGRIARAAPTAFPGIVQGVKTGAAGGPMAAVAGGVVGGASRFLPRRRTVAPPRGSAPPPPPAPQGVEAPPMAPAPAPAPTAAPMSVGEANPAAAQLLALLQDPRLAEACVALTRGAQGPREISVGGTVARPAAFLNLLCWLAQEAAQQAPAGGETVDGYLRGPDGSYVTDVASPAARARVLLERLQSEGAAGAPTGATGGGTAEQWLLDSGMAELV